MAGRSPATKIPFSFAALTTYNRTAAVNYARTWAYKRNSAWGNFDGMGGDCTNFASQVLNAGGIPMDTGGDYFWFYKKMGSGPGKDTRSASWSGVKELYEYIVANTRYNGINGPQGKVVNRNDVKPGDLIQIDLVDKNGRTDGKYDHTVIVTKAEWQGILWWKKFVIEVAAHTTDRKDYNLDNYKGNFRYIQILGYRKN